MLLILLSIHDITKPPLQGRLRGKIGLFPSNYVAVTSESPLPGDALSDDEKTRLEMQLQQLAQPPS
jgi:hypothetical protein